MNGKSNKEKGYRVVVIGNIPPDMIQRVSKIHAKAFLKAENENAIDEKSLKGRISNENPEKESNS